MSFPSPVETAMLVFINEERQSNGLAPLTFDGSDTQPPRDPDMINNIFAPLGPIENMLLKQAARRHGSALTEDLLAEIGPGDDKYASSGYINFTRPFNIRTPYNRQLPNRAAEQESLLTAASA